MVINKFNKEKKKSMKIFISWSGEISFKVAKVLKDWIPCVIQDIYPYFSSEDIDKGARWSTDIAKELETASFGILCVTKDNLNSKWLNFEAGALSKAVDKTKVCPLLFRLKPSDISDSPILQFQMAHVDRDDIYKVFKSINETLGESRLDEARLERVFNTFWPNIEQDFNSIQDSERNNESDKTKKEANAEILEEMLELLRSQQMLLKNPERILPVEYIEHIFEQIRVRNVEELTNEIPVSAIADLMKKEGEIKNLISALDEVDNIEDIDVVKLKARVLNFINATNKIMRIIGFDISLNE